MAFYGPILSLSPTTGGPGNTVVVTFPVRPPGTLDPLSPFPMRVGFAPAQPAAAGGTVIGGLVYTAQWTALDPDRIRVTVPPVGTANPAVEMPPGDYVVDVAQGFDRAHTADVFHASATPTPAGPPAPVLPARPAPPPFTVPPGMVLTAAGTWVPVSPPAPAAPPPGMVLTAAGTFVPVAPPPAPPPPAPAAPTPAAWPFAMPASSLHALSLSLLPSISAPYVLSRQRRLQRITTGVPWPRGLVFVPATPTESAKLVALARGRPRGANPGGPVQSDRAGTLFAINPNPRVVEWSTDQGVSGSIASNWLVLAEPHPDPFKLFTGAQPPTDDIETDRPYAGLAREPESGIFFIACFSGIDLPPRGFRKNATDAIHRFDPRDNRWHGVEYHDPGNLSDAERRRPDLSAIPNNLYPNPPRHGLLNGPDGVCVYGNSLYAVAKDNHVLARYSLDDILQDVNTGLVEGTVLYQGSDATFFDSPSAVAVNRDGSYLYVSFRAQTKNAVYRFPLDQQDGTLNGPAEMVAVFPDSSQLIDMAFNDRGDLYVSAATGAPDAAGVPNKVGAIWRVPPLPGAVFAGAVVAPFVTLPAKCSNIAVDDRNYLYVCCNRKEDPAARTGGVIYRVM